MIELNSTYARETLSDILKSFLPEDLEFYLQPKEIRLSQQFKRIKKAHIIAEIPSLDLTIFELHHSSPADPRIELSKEAFRILAESFKHRAIVIIKNQKSDQWRLSLMTIDLNVDKKGRVQQIYSNPRRYSYLLGPDTKTVTPGKYLLRQGNVKSFEDLQQRFAPEVVNNEFYKEISKLYDVLVGADKIKRALKYPGSDEESHEFAVRLIGRIIFCWFLREKKSGKNLPLIPKTLLSRDAAGNPNYYHKTLAPLFFEVLNKDPEKRSPKFKTNGFQQIPYLNGGLFSNDEIDHYRFDKVLEFSVPGLIGVPDSWLQKLFDLLELYNFTVDENTSYDVDLSIDPEMLGRVFENLLARINPETGETVRKSTGSFYTPREIVDYMVDTSLTEYLLTKTKVNRTKIEALVSYDLEDDIGNELAKEEGEEVLEALSTLTVLDPACGSGAFPIGMLQKIVFVISILDPNAKWWLSRQLKNASPEIRREFENKGVDYIRKLGIIRQTIFGVDIQPIATEISRLRCFLTLIVDEDIDDSAWNRGIRPLPNLDFKFVTADTLIPLPKPDDKKGIIGEGQSALFEETSHIDELKELRSSYFTSINHERLELQAKFSELQRKMFIKNVDEFGGQASGLYETLSRWEPFGHKPSKWFDSEWMFGISGGFDIVIGNPPYLSTEKLPEPYKGSYKAEYKDIHMSRTDVYTYFYKRGLELTKTESGLLCYITSNNWMRAEYGFKLRAYLANNNPLVLIDFAGLRVFNSATIDTSILLVQSCPKRSSLTAARFNAEYTKPTSIKDFFNDRSVHISEINENSWFIGTLEEVALREKIRSQGVPLKEWGSDISRGIISGFNKAFIISASKREELICKDPNSKNIIKPMLKGRDIKKYGYKFNDIYVLVVGYGHYRTLEAEYPAVYTHLTQYESQLKQRGQCKASRNGRQISNDFPGQHHWLELDNNPGDEYLGRFEDCKIAWADLADKGKFSIIEAGYYLDKTAFFLVDQGNYKYFLGILNSKLIDWYFDTICSSSGVGTNLWSKVFVEKLPIPQVDDKKLHIKEAIEDLSQIITTNKKNDIDVQASESEMDDLIYSLYELTPEEIKIVEKGRV